MTDNPKDPIGRAKPSMSPVPANVLLLLGAVLRHGAEKYGRHNWRDAGISASVYYDAALRHLFSWWEGETIDPESGLPHLAHAMASLCIVLDATDQGKITDDRPKASAVHPVTRHRSLPSDPFNPAKAYAEFAKYHDEVRKRDQARLDALKAMHADAKGEQPIHLTEAVEALDPTSGAEAIEFAKNQHRTLTLAFERLSEQHQELRDSYKRLRARVAELELTKP